MADGQISGEMAAIARRCMEDAEYAQGLIAGDQYPEIREALLADIAANAEVQGFLNPCPEPPGVQFTNPAALKGAPAFIPQAQWTTFGFANLNALASR